MKLRDGSGWALKIISPASEFPCVPTFSHPKLIMPQKCKECALRSPSSLPIPHCQPGGRHSRTYLDRNALKARHTHRHPTLHDHIATRRALGTLGRTHSCADPNVHPHVHRPGTDKHLPLLTTQTCAHQHAHTSLCTSQCIGQAHTRTPHTHRLTHLPHTCLPRPGPAAVHTNVSIRFLFSAHPGV